MAAANGEGSGYAAMALLLPGEGSSIASGASAVEESMEEAVEAGKAELAEAASRAEEAARAAEEARLGVSPATAATIRPIACTSARGASQG